MNIGARNPQQISSAGIVLAVAVIVTWLSYTGEPADAFLFPRLISVVFLVLSLWNFARAALGLARVGGGIDATSAINIIPGLAVMVVYIFWLAQLLGFYTASTLTFFTLLTLYYTGSHAEPGGWMQRAIITAGFMAVMK